MTTGQMMFYGGVALLAVTIILAVIFMVKKPVYHPENAAAMPNDNRTRPLRNGYPTDPLTVRRDAPAKAAEETVPLAEGTTPLAGDTVPLNVGTAPLAEGTTPLAGETAPLAEGTAPLASETTPLAEGTTPLAEGTTPLAGETAPLAEGTTPLAGETALLEQE